MDSNLLLAEAARANRVIVAGIDDRHLAAPTPCAGWDVAALIHHLLQWGPTLEGAARKEIVPPGAAPGDWSKTLPDQLDRLAAAWSAPAAWTGVTHLGGPAELPADLVGGMVLGEFVLHGWDLARALGRHPEWDEEVLRLVYDEVARSADQGRAMGVYAAEVPVAPTASRLDRTLALSGRNPSWRPSTPS